MDDAEARRRARASWETRIFKDDPEGEADADARFWAAMSPEDRVLLAWTLSQEMFALASPDAMPVEPGLARSLVRVVRLASTPHTEAGLEANPIVGERWERAWNDELARRVGEVERGEAQLLTEEEFFADDSPSPSGAVLRNVGSTGELDCLSERARFVGAVEEGLADEQAGRVSAHADVEARMKARFRTKPAR